MIKNKFKDFMNKFKVDDGFDDDFYEEESNDFDYGELDAIEEEPSFTPSNFSSTTSTPNYKSFEMDTKPKNETNAFSFQETKPKRKNTNATSTIHVVKPTVVEDWRIICDHLVNNEVSIINLDGTNTSLPQRITDALSGACYALGAKFRYINHNIMIVVPHNIALEGDVQKSLNETLKEMTSNNDSFEYGNVDQLY